MERRKLAQVEAELSRVISVNHCRTHPWPERMILSRMAVLVRPTKADKTIARRESLSGLFHCW